MLKFLLRKSLSLIVWSIVMGLISGAAGTAILAMVNYALASRDGAGVWLIFGYLAAAALGAGSTILSNRFLANMGETAVYDLRLRLCRQITAASLEYLEKTGSAKLFANLTEDVLSISHGLIVLPVLFSNATLILGCFVYLGWLSWSLLLFLMVLLLFGFITFQFGVRRAYNQYQAARNRHDELFGHLRTAIEGVKELKLHAARHEQFRALDLEPAAAASKAALLGAMRTMAYATGWGVVLIYLIIGCLAFGIPIWGEIPRESLVGFVLTVFYLLCPILALVGQIPAVTRAKVAFEKIQSLGAALESELDVEVCPVTENAVAWQQLELRQVEYTYYSEENHPFTLGPVDLVLQPGELVFITGGNGSGKSTLVKLLTSLYRPASGEILLDGVPIRDENLAAYRQIFSVIFYDYFLFDRLVGGLSDKLDARAQQYLEKLELSHRVRVTEGKLSTTALSAGQRKRLALLAAYLDDRPIYVFDEWASDQDPAFKEVFYRQIVTELRDRGKAVVVVTHDDRYFDLADRLLKLDEGRLVEIRPHASPLTSGGMVQG